MRKKDECLSDDHDDLEAKIVRTHNNDLASSDGYFHHEKRQE